MSSSAGIGDPYWYEWSVGLRYIVEMLDENSPIVGVTLQSTNAVGLDDVVVRERELTRFIQVKHTRAEDTLTFGDLITKESGEGDGGPKLSLLEKLSAGWAKERRNAPNCQVVLNTNRALGTRPITVGAEIKTVRPALSTFWASIRSQRGAANTLSDFNLPPEWSTAWSEFLSHLSMDTNTSKVEFIKHFEIDAGQPDLAEIEQNLADRLAHLLGVSAAQSRLLLASLDSSLRRWATSLRGKGEEVDRAELYRKMCLDSGANQEIGDHLLPPPVPFHESRLPTAQRVTDSLKVDGLKVVFLTGSPGSGKTSLVSLLLNQREPFIDFRYFAFKPISLGPTALEDRLATPEALWGDLLCQLRNRLSNRLHEFRLAVRNDFLNAEQRKQEFLRVCSAWGQQRGKAVIVAIDGLDHAARSRRLRPDLPSFLSSFPRPEQMPEFVKLLVAGQPDYAEYPRWLLQPDPAVCRVIELPALEVSDVRMLLASVAPELESQDLSAEFIQQVCVGNTLATHFAVQEARRCGNLCSLQETLLARKLDQGLQAYYDNLWDAAAARTNAVSPQRLAALLSLVEEPIPADFLDTVTDPGIGRTQAIDTLRQLRPLVTEVDNKFKLFHNDFRVYLSVVVAAAPELREVSGRLADHLCSSSTHLAAKHRYTLRLLELAERRSDFAKLVTPEWIIEGWVTGSSYSSITGETQAVADILAKKVALDWSELHRLACSIHTVLQLGNSLEWVQEEQRYLDRPEIPLRGFVTTELSVSSRDSWTLDLLINVARDARLLCGFGFKERARGLLQRWFNSIDLDDLLPKRPTKQTGLRDGHEEQRQNCEKGALFCRELGGCWSALGDSPLAFPKDVQYAASIMGGTVKECIRTHDWKFLVGIVATGQPIFVNDIESILDGAVDRALWAITAILLNNFAAKGKYSVYLRLKFAVYSILAGNEEVAERWLGQLRSLATSEIQKHSDDNHLRGNLLGVESLCCLCFVAAYGAVSHEYLDQSFARLQQLYQNEGSSYGMLLRSSAIFGKWLKSIRLGRKFTELNPDDFHRLCSNLLQFKGIGYSPDMPDLCSRIVKGLFWCAERSSPDFDTKLIEISKFVLQKRRLGRPLKLAWETLRSRQKYEALREFIGYWLNPENGSLWSEDAADRQEYYEEIRSLAGANLELPMESAEMLKWGCIQYSSRKEYSLSPALSWLSELARIQPSAWEAEGLGLLELSNNLPEHCDNRLAGSILTTVASAAVRCGARDFLRFMQSSGRQNRLYLGSGLVDGLLSGMKRVRLSNSEALELWSLGMGILTWQDQSDSGQIQELYDLIVAATDVPAELLHSLRALTPFEADRCEQNAFFDKERSYRREVSSLEAQVQTQPFDQALKQVEAHIREAGKNRGDAWAAISLLLKRLRSDAPGNSTEILGSLRHLLEMRDGAYGWYFDGAEEAHDNLVPLLNDSELTEYSRQVLRGLESAGSDRLWLDSSSKNLGRHSLARASHGGASQLKEGLSLELAMHQAWLTGAGRLPWRGRTISASTWPESSTWAEVGFEILLSHLSASGATAVATALQGLYLLAQRDPALLTSVGSRWLNLDEEVKDYLLLLAEQWARKFPEQFDQIRAWVQLAYDGTNLGHKLQAWVVYRTRELLTNEPIPQMRWNPNADESFTRHGQPVYAESKPRSYGHQSFSTEQSAVDKLLLHLTCLTRLNAPPLQAEVALYSSNVIATKEREVERRGDVYLAPPIRTKILFHVIHQRLDSPPWNRIGPGTLAAALCRGDEPEILFAQSPPIFHAGVWVSQEILEKGVVNKIEDELKSMASAKLPENTELLACEIRAYSKSKDYVFHVDARWRENYQLLDKDGHPFTPLSRCFTFFDDYPHPRIGGVSLCNRVGGLFRLNSAALWLCIDRPLAAQLGWAASVSRPLEWHRDGRKVAWLERYAGQLDKYVHDKSYRIPMMQRWVILSEELDRARQLLGGYFYLSSQLTTSGAPD